MIKSIYSFTFFGNKVKPMILGGAELPHEGGKGEEKDILISQDVLFSHSKHGQSF